MNERGQVIDINSIIRILPHKPPATLIDRVIEVEPGARIITSKNVTINEPAVAGHFPGLPILPGSVVLEVMIQSSCLLAYTSEQVNPSSKIVTLVGISKAKFHRTVGPGDTLEVESLVTRRQSNVWRFEVKAFVDDTNVCEAEIVLSVQERDDAI